MIPGYLREFDPDEWPLYDWKIGDTFRRVVVDELARDPSRWNEWRRADPPLSTGRCRYMIPGRHACGRPSVVELKRPTYTKTGKVDRWWGYCDNPAHLFGRHYADGRLETVILVPARETP